MDYIDFYCDKNAHNLDDVDPKIIKKNAESYYNISWTNNREYINVAFQEVRKFEEIGPITDNMSELQINVLRNAWKKKVSRLRLRSIPHWSVMQRKMPLIASTELYINAGFNDYLDRNIMNIIHWGSNNYLAVIVNQTVRILHFGKFGKKTTFRCQYVIKINNNKIGACLRWNRTATNIAIAAKEKEIEVWDPVKEKYQFTYQCQCETETCRIESMEWSVSDKLLSGCSNGIHKGAITKIIFSSQDQYLATSGTDKTVKIWIMPDCILHYTFECNKHVRAIAWHPWTEHHFVIGGYTNDNLLTLWNAKKIDSFRKLRAVPNCGSDVFMVKDLTFNPTSGELVVSYAVSNIANTINGCRGLIFVYSNLLSMVDIIHWHKGSLLYLLWNNDGSKLISLDILGKGVVWDFLGDRDKTFIKPETFP